MGGAVADDERDRTVATRRVAAVRRRSDATPNGRDKRCQPKPDAESGGIRAARGGAHFAAVVVELVDWFAGAVTTLAEGCWAETSSSLRFVELAGRYS